MKLKKGDWEVEGTVEEMVELMRRLGMSLAPENTPREASESIQEASLEDRAHEGKMDHPRLNVDLQEVRRLRELGLSHREIGRKMGIANTTVSKILKREGISTETQPASEPSVREDKPLRDEILSCLRDSGGKGQTSVIAAELKKGLQEVKNELYDLQRDKLVFRKGWAWWYLTEKNIEEKPLDLRNKVLAYFKNMKKSPTSMRAARRHRRVAEDLREPLEAVDDTLHKLADSGLLIKYGSGMYALPEPNPVKSEVRELAGEIAEFVKSCGKEGCTPRQAAQELKATLNDVDNQLTALTNAGLLENFVPGRFRSVLWTEERGEDRGEKEEEKEED